MSTDAAASGGADDPAVTSGFGHAKVILLGEHAVVHGHPAIAAGLPLGVRAQVRPGSGRVLVPAWQLDLALGDSSPVGQALGRICRRLGADPRQLDVAMEADIPGRGGLGSSAAMAVAVALAIGKRTGAAEADVDAAVGLSETVFHGTPSGVDAAAARHGGVGVFQREGGWRAAPMRQPIKLCVGLSGETRQTSTLVESVAHLCQRSAPARRLLDTIGEMSQAGLQALEVGDIDSLGRLFDLSHGALAGLRVSTLALERLVYGARAAGAIGAKLTGAGGGGAVIALAPSHRQHVLDRWRTDGFEGFTTAVGAT